MKYHRIDVALLMIAVIGLVGACRQGNVSEETDPTRVASREVFLLPKDYRGPFVAIYDQPNGVQPSWRGDTATFVVDPNGIVRIRSSEPPRTTRTSHSFVGAGDRVLPNYPTCADMRVHAIDNRVAVCWLDFSVKRPGTPDNVVAVITDWEDIPKNFERTTFVFDSVLLGGAGLGRRQWEEPRDMKRQRASSQVISTDQ